MPIARPETPLVVLQSPGQMQGALSCFRRMPFFSSHYLRAHLQIDHIRPFAKGGSSHDEANLRCLCRAHNLYLAKKDFPTYCAVGQRS